MKFLFIFFLAAFTFFIIGTSSINSFINNCEDGNGKVVTRDHITNDFSGISSNIAADIIIEKAATNKVIIEVDENLQDNIELKVKDGKLNISNKKCFNAKRTVKITIQTPELDAISLNGTGNIKWRDNFISEKLTVRVSGAGDVDGVVNTEDLSVSIGGAGDVSLKGSATNQNIKISGAGKYLGEKIQGNNAEVEVSGSGNASMGELKILDAKVSGVGNIYYKGEPTITRSVSGIGKVARK